MSQIKKNSIATIILIVLALAFLLESLNFVYASFKKTPNSYEPPLSDISFDDKNVLFISSYSPTHPALFYETTGLAEIFDHNNVNFDIVYMDTEKYNDPENFRHFYNAITYKLNSYKKYDGIIAGDDAALMFVQEYQSELFPNMPIVFFATEDLAAAERASQNPNMAGVAQKLFLTDTIQLALKVNPAATKICAIVDNSLTGKGNQKQFFAEKRNFPDKEFFTINTDEKSRAQITESLGAIDDHTILIFMSFLSDMDGQHYSLTESLALITKSVAVPVYRTKVGGMGMGVFGGKIYDLKSAGIQAAQIMTDVISQKANISHILQSEPIGGTYYIDTQLMKKFGIKKRLLPKSTVFVNESNGGDSGRKNLSIAAVFFAIALMLVAAAIIVGYLYAKKAQNVVRMRNIAIARKNRMLKESAKRMKIMSENDFLTEIPNRFSAVTEISRLLEANAKFSLYLMDIDDF
ncbi:MAG: hypothetical protein II921_03960, partial [Treponema sp.]|nr:hypothetical protein [Treponema sp.]